MSDPTVSRPATDVALSVTEFGDRLNPVFVRELRRSLRAPFFVAGFFVLHSLALLAALVESGLTTALSNATGPMPGVGALSIVMFLAFAFAFPLGQINSLQCEFGPGRNVELLVTSQLGVWQIAVGRILVATSVAAILLVSMLPYLLLRYFLGGIELADLLRSSAGLLLANLAMNSIVTGASAFRNWFGRLLLIGSLAVYYFSFAAPYRLAPPPFFGIAGGIIAFAGEILAALLFVLLGAQLALSPMRRFATPHALPEASVSLIFAFFLLPVVHTVGFGAGGMAGGAAALALSLFLTWQLGAPPRKKKLKPAPPRPPLPQP